jgi:hypothetical protein
MIHLLQVALLAPTPVTARGELKELPIHVVPLLLLLLLVLPLGSRLFCLLVVIVLVLFIIRSYKA